MADNTRASDDPLVATRKVAYSGDTADLQAAALVLVTGSDDAKTAADVDGNSGNKSAGTVRVVLATDQPQLTAALKVDASATTQPVSGTVTANAGTNLNTSALATSALQTAEATLVGAVTETAPASDTASSGLNGRLQRIAQRLTSIIALLPAALGAGGGLKVDGSGTALPVSGTVGVSGSVAVTNADITTVAGAIRAEDAASANAHTGIVNLAVRKAAPADTSDTDGDYEMLQMKSGRLWASATIDAALPAGNANIGDVDVVTLPALVAGTANIGDVDVLTVPADPFGANADAIVAAGAAGSLSAKLRRTTQGLEDLKTGIILAAGTAGIGKLTANSGIDIGDVDVTSIIPGTGATNQGKAVDAVAGATDTGIAPLAIRDDVLANLTPVDGDYTNLRVDAQGRLWTAGTYAEDAAHTDLDPGHFMLGRRIDALASSAGASGDYAALNVDAIGALWVRGQERLVGIAQSPTVTAGAYLAGDVVGGLLTFANAAPFSGGPITVETMTICNRTPALNMALELWLFSQTFTNVADNGVVSYSDADANNCIGVLPCGPWADNALNSISTRTGIGLGAVLAGTSLFGQLVTRTAVSLTGTTDINLALYIRQG